MAKIVIGRTLSSSTDSVIDAAKLLPVEYDFIAASYPDDNTEVYTYKSGGVGGTTVATITVTYADGILQSVART